MRGSQLPPDAESRTDPWPTDPTGSMPPQLCRGEATPRPSMVRRCITGATDTGHRSVSHRPPWPTRAGDGSPALTGTASWMSERNTPLTSAAMHVFARILRSRRFRMGIGCAVLL